MDTPSRHQTPAARALRQALTRAFTRVLALALLGLMTLAAGGCAMLPFALTSAASLAMPQTASLAMSGVKGAYQTAQLAADERDMNTIMRDNMLTLKAKSALLTERSAADVHVYAYTGDIFAVGLVDNEEQREHVIAVLQAVKGVDEVKGVLRLRDLESPYEGLKDNFLENTTRLALGRYLLHKNAGVEISAVQGELCLMGVVGTHAEALDLIQYVESVSGTRAMSLLAIRDEYAAGKRETNHRYLLATSPDAPPTNSVRARVTPPGEQAQAAPEHARLALSAPANTRDLPPAVQKTQNPQDEPEQPAAWNKTRLRLGQKLQLLAKREAAPTARAELLTLAQQVATDRDLSIADRLSVAADQATHQHARLKIQSLLALF